MGDFRVRCGEEQENGQVAIGMNGNLQLTLCGFGSYLQDERETWDKEGRHPRIEVTLIVAHIIGDTGTEVSTSLASWPSHLNFYLKLTCLQEVKGQRLKQTEEMTKQ